MSLAETNKTQKAAVAFTNETATATVAKVGKTGHVPIWPAFIALVVLGVLFSLLSAQLTVARLVWLVPVVVGLLLVFLVFSWLRHIHNISRVLGRLATSFMTLALLVSVVLLVTSVFDHTLAGPALLQDAAILWVSNILVFGLWYWELDGGGPRIRHLHGYTPTDFLFPQVLAGKSFSQNWLPGFVDYLYLAFNTNTAFSPTDTSVLTGRAKILMIMQSLLSLVTIAVIAARAINIIPSGG